MLDLEHDRREHPRISLHRPCKVYDPRSRRYISGETCNVSDGGLLLRLDRTLHVEPGDRIFVGVAQRRSQAVLKSNEMIEAKVVRALPMTSGETGLALRTLAQPAALMPTIMPATRRAA